jgi:hypothetical protein
MTVRRTNLLPNDAAALVRGSTMTPQAAADIADAKPNKSKRGIDKSLTSQICFRIEKERHHALRVHCIQNRIEIGELLSDLIKDKLSI